MKPMDRSVFKQLLTGIHLLHGKTLHEAVLELWWQALIAFEFPAVKKALEAHITHPVQGRFMPVPANVTGYLEGSHESRALKAWSDVAESLRRVGAYESVVFADALIHAVILDMGGWVKLCQTPEKELPFRAKEFEARYQAMLQHPPREIVSQLSGLLAQSHRAWGRQAPEPVRIGHSKTLRLVEVAHEKIV